MRKTFSITETEDYQNLLFEQKLAFHAILEGESVIVTGGGGVGKSYLIKFLQRHLPGLVLTATTGIASVNIGASTVDSLMGFGGRPMMPDEAAKVRRDLREALSTIKILLIDEASMLRIDRLECIDVRLRVAKGNNKPFGGIQVVLVADFCQLLPIAEKRKGFKEQFIQMYGRSLLCFESPVFKAVDFKPYVLTEYVRQGNDEQRRVLRNIRMGSKIDDAIACINDMAQGKEDENTIHLCGTNREADSINDERFAQVKGLQKTYFAKTQGKFEYKPLPETIVLKEGMRVMITANNADDDYYNGDLGYVSALTISKVYVNLDRGGTVEVKPFDYQEYGHENKEEQGAKEGKEREPVGTYTQMPIKPAYAITTHKSQGLTLENVSLHLQNMFADAQTYVGLSRVKSFENLCLPVRLRKDHIKTNRLATKYTKEISLQALERQLEDAKRFGVTKA